MPPLVNITSTYFISLVYFNILRKKSSPARTCFHCYKSTSSIRKHYVHILNSTGIYISMLRKHSVPINVTIQHRKTNSSYSWTHFELNIWSEIRSPSSFSNLYYISFSLSKYLRLSIHCVLRQ